MKVRLVSDGYLKLWQSLNFISKSKIKGGILSGDILSAQQFYKCVRRMKNKQVYWGMTSTTPLNWRQVVSLFRKWLPSRRESFAVGYKVSQDRITVMVSDDVRLSHFLPVMETNYLAASKMCAASWILQILRKFLISRNLYWLVINEFLPIVKGKW